MSKKPDLVDTILEAIKEGEFDGRLTGLYDALDARLTHLDTESKKTAPAAPKTAPAATERKVPAPPKKKVTPKTGAEYKITANAAKVGGAIVKFLKYKEGDRSKVQVEMMTDKPGFPKGKKFITPLVALEEKPATTARKTTAAKKTTAAPAKKTASKPSTAAKVNDAPARKTAVKRTVKK